MTTSNQSHTKTSFRQSRKFKTRCRTRWINTKATKCAINVCHQANILVYTAIRDYFHKHTYIYIDTCTHYSWQAGTIALWH